MDISTGKKCQQCGNRFHIMTSSWMIESSHVWRHLNSKVEFFWILTYCQTSNISHTFIGNKLVDHSVVVGTSPVGAAPTISSFFDLTPGFTGLVKDKYKTRCDKKWKLKNVEKITSFSDTVTLTFDLRPWKVNQVRTLSLPMYIPNLRTIHPVVFELSR